MESPLTLHCGFEQDAVDLAVSILYFLLFIPALIFNGLAAWVSLHLRSESTFMVYLKNLVAADFLMALILPLEAANLLPNGSVVLKAIHCQYSGVIFYSCTYMSIIFLCLISLDRFFKIVRPGGRTLGQNLLFGRVISASVWGIYLGTITFPTIILTNESRPNSSRKGFCMEMKSEEGKTLHAGAVITNNVIFWVASIIIAFCYICIARTVFLSYRNSGSNNDNVKRKTKARVFLVLVVFLLCFAPYHVIHDPHTQLQISKVHNCKSARFNVAKEFTLWLSATNMFLDPLIYFFLCRAFRKKLNEIFRLESVPESQSSRNNNDTRQTKLERPKTLQQLYERG